VQKALRLQNIIVVLAYTEGIPDNYNPQKLISEIRGNNVNYPSIKVIALKEKAD